MVKLIAAGVGVFFTLVIASCGMQIVDTGHRGVKTHFSEVVGEPLPEGIYFVNPFTTDIAELDTRVQSWEGETQSYTRDVQQAVVTFTLNYRLEPTKAHIMYRDVGTDWEEKILTQVIYEDIKREVGQHNAVDIIAQRDAAARGIEASVKRVLEERDVLVTDFQLTGLTFTEKFEHSVEEKVVAQQKAIEEQNRTVQKEELAKQAIAIARGDADATLLRAKAEAESIRIRATALEQNAKLVDWEIAQRWDGKLPTMMMGGAIPLLNLPSAQK